MNLPDGLQQKEAAAALGVTVRQFVRYRRRYKWLQPVALTGLVPVFESKDVERLRAQVQADKLAMLAALARRRAGGRAGGRSGVVTMAELRAAKRKAGR